MKDFGVIDVVVDRVEDSPDQDLPKLEKTIRDTIDRVKAAGIYVRLNYAQPIKVDGIFRVDISANRQSLTNAELQSLEETIARSIRDLIRQTKMGEPLLFSRLLKEVISLEGVENLADFRLQALFPEIGIEDFTATNNKIEVGDSERLKPGDLCVAAGDKQLPVDVEIRVTQGLNDANDFKELESRFQKYTASLGQGKNFIVEDFLNKLRGTNSPPGFVIQFQRITPKPWCPRGNIIKYDGKNFSDAHASAVNVSMVETVVPGRLFAFSDYLEVTGALNIELAQNLDKDAAKLICEKVKNKVSDYIYNLGPKEDLLLDMLKELAMTVEGVLGASWKAGDFKVEKSSMDKTSERVLVNDKKISLFDFEKMQIKRSNGNNPLSYFMVAYQTETVNLSVNVTVQNGLSGVTDNQVKAITQNFLKKSPVGKNISLIELIKELESQIGSASVSTLTINATSADGRIQEKVWNSSSQTPVGSEIHIRSMEKVNPLNITVSI